MPRKYAPEFRQDVVRFALNRPAGMTLAQVAADFGIGGSTLDAWIRREQVSKGVLKASAGEDKARIAQLERQLRLKEEECFILRRAAAYLARDVNPKMIYPLVEELAGLGIAVSRICRVLGIARQPFYRWRGCRQSRLEQRRSYLKERVRAIHSADPAFGYRLITDELARQGVKVASRTVWSICHELGIRSITAPKGKTKTAKSARSVGVDLVGRVFHADGPNRLWLTDITEHPTTQGKLYVCAIKDVWSNRIVALSSATSMSASLAVNALAQAVADRHPPAGCVIHSDRGAQFTSTAYRQATLAYGLVQSMGQAGTCADNAAMESFFALLQKNVLNTRKWETRQELATAIRHWIESTYHRRRRQARLGKLTPIEYETIYTN
ncbi:IS3 family transposase [Buchananella felis]|uniref:IS3 family transposase n=1 Tax=Buchananella felis TaxID=3231492 RepID=UPI0035276114